MSLRNSKRNRINNFIWFCSGLNVRELSSLYQSRSNYFGIGGINIFSTITILSLGIWSASVAFPKISLVIPILIGFVLSLILFVFNRQTVSALSIADKSQNNRKHTLTFLPILIFSIFVGFVISTPLKLELLEIPLGSSFIERIKALQNKTDSSLMRNGISFSITIITILISILPTLIQYYSLRSNFQKNRSSLLNEFMWYCAGVNKNILRKCPNDYTKYFGIGGTILFTALMATMSGGYAFYTAFGSINISICFGLFWGAMIFNLDRFIVNTMYSDGEHSISTRELIGGLPRIVIAIFLGIVISYPLELRLFEDSINERIEIMKVNALKEHNTVLDEAYGKINKNEQKITSGDSRRDKLQSEIDNAYDEFDAFKKNWPVKYWITDSLGNRISKTRYDYPPERAEKKQRFDNILARNQPLIDEIILDSKNIKQEIIGDKEVKKGFETAHITTTKALNDLTTRMEAFSQLKDDPKKKSITWASWFIMLLLIIIEVSPVLFKMMIAKGDYDVMLTSDNNEIEVEELVRMSKKNDWANTEISKIIEENKVGLASNVELLNSIAKAQSEIAQVAIEKWKEQEIKKAQENPGNIIS
jgi:hypothetical protein